MILTKKETLLTNLKILCEFKRAYKKMKCIIEYYGIVNHANKCRMLKFLVNWLTLAVVVNEMLYVLSMCV